MSGLEFLHQEYWGSDENVSYSEIQACLNRAIREAYEAGELSAEDENFYLTQEALHRLFLRLLGVDFSEDE